MAGSSDVRCFCQHKTLLGKVARDPETGAPCLHVMMKASGRTAREMVILSGTVKLKCRDCTRWHLVRIRREGVDVAPARNPMIAKA
jgi:hypothetical protein